MTSARPSATRTRLAIVGYAFRFPGPAGDGFWRALCEGRNLVTTVHESRWAPDSFYHPRESEPGAAYTRAGGSLGDVSGFDAAFFGISPREAAEMDPQQRLLLELTWEALESGGIPPFSIRGSRCSAMVGFSGSDYGYRGAEDIAAINSFSMTGINGSISANRISYAFDLRGPSMAVDTACSSSLVAFHQACQSILSGDADMAISGAVNLHLHPLAYIAFSKASMLSKQGACRAFDASSDGYVRSEGSAIVVLKPLENAVRDGNRIYAVVAGSGLNSDGRTNGLTVPSAEAQAALLRDVYARAGIDPADIDYIEAHGTGTAVGDPIEARALGEALGKRRPAGSPLRIGSVKSNLGHLETASGMAGLVKAILCLQHRSLPRSIHFETPNPRIAFADWNLKVVAEQTALAPDKRLVIGINSFGFGGANAHVILESYGENKPKPARGEGRAVPLFVSGRSEAALKASALRFADWIREREDLPAYDIAYSAAFHRDWHAHRAIAFGHDRKSLANALQAFGRDNDTRNVAAGRALANARGPAFIYSGNGSQWAGMGGLLLAESPVFREAVSRVSDRLLQYSDVPVLEVLAGGGGAAQRLEATEVAQPTLFAVQVGITEMLAAWGLRPTAVAGHSVGEMAAAWASGALSLDQAAYLVCERSAWQGTTRGAGAMTAVGLGVQKLQPLIEATGAKLAIAALNSPGSVTVSGAREELAALEALLQSLGIAHQRLALDYAFHSPSMDAIRNGVEGALARIKPGSSRIPYYSTVTGGRLAGESLDAAYWWRNIRDAVQFGPAVAQMLQAGESIFIEIGPHPVLRGYLGECLRAAAADGRVIATMSRKADGLQALRLRAFEALIAGCEAELGALFPEKGGFVDLPHYPWQRERHWLAPSGEGSGLVGRRQVHSLLGYRLDQDEWQWECHLDTLRAPAYADHCVGGQAILPAAGYVEMALAASFELDAAAAREIEDLEIRAPLPLSAKHSRSVRLLLDPASGNFTVKSRERLSNDAWQVHATGRLTANAGHANAALARFELPSSRTPISGATHYRLAAEAGLDYGPAFRAVTEAWRDDQGGHAAARARPCVSAKLETPASIEGSVAGTFLHPSYLDAAFQLLLHLFDEKNEDAARGVAFVPVRIGRATLLKPHARPAYARVREMRRGPRSLVAQCTLYGEDCEPVAVLREVRFRAVSLRESALAGLSSVRVRAVPGPVPSTTGRAALPPADQLIAACAARLHASARQEMRWRYFKDVEPLLEALLAAFAAAAVKELKDEPRGVLLERLVRLASDDKLPEPGAIWSQMLRDYPDHASEILWIGRLGMHLADIARGTVSAERFMPQPDGADSDAWTAPWMPATADYTRAIADLVDVSLESLPHGRRLRVLAINAEHSPAVVNVLAGLNRRRFDLTVAGADYGQGQAALDGGPFDLVLVEDGLASATDREAALRTLRRQTADEGLLVLLERHPSRAVLLAMEFLSPGSEAHPRVRPLAPGIWHNELARQGFQQAMVIEDVPGIEASSYLLIARAVAGEGSHAPLASAPQRRWLVSGEKSGRASKLAAALSAELRRHGEAVELVQSDPVSGAAWEELLQSACARLGEIDSVVMLSGLAESRQAPEEMLKRQVGRSESLAGLLSACSARGAKPDIWAVTAQAMTMLLPPAARKAMRLGANADDAPFWGFMRTAINEHPDLKLRLVDLSSPDAGQAAAGLAQALLQADAEDEMILTPAGRFVVRVDMAPFARRAALDPARSLARLESPQPGQLKNLRWTQRPLRAPGEGEVAIDVRTAGLNFRDVMYAMGQLSDEALEGGFAGPTLGMEVAGVISAVGRGVHGLAPGDAVMAFAPAGFATQAVTRAGAVLKKPPNWSFEAAATVQTTFFTAYYALHHLGRLAPGERILIHGGAGGVGLAAIQIAQMKGAEIFATAGSEAKRDLLRLLGVKHVLDSRSLDFADEIMARTDGQGLDMVLNSLAGEAMHRGLQVLRPMGRFLELGKRDFYENTHVGLRPLRNNISYFGVDADQLMLERPELTRALMQELMLLFEAGTLHALPYRAFRAQDAVAAFRFMQQSRHIGKIVLAFESPPAAEADAAQAPQRRLTLPAEATYLVTGGLRGFGLRTAQWLAERGARHLVLAGRSEALEPDTMNAIAALSAQGVQVKAARCDVTDRAALKSLFAEMRDTMPPLRGVVHASAVFRDGLVRNLERERIEAVLAPKVLGAANLHLLTKPLKLDFFVLFSSASTVFGNPGQASYVGANRYLEALAESRRARGLPALCVGWGPIDDAGYLARNKEIKERLESRLGGSAFSAAQALDALEQMLLENLSGIAVLKFDRAGLSRFLSSARSPKYQPLVVIADDSARAPGSADDLRRWVERTGDAEVLRALTEMLNKEIGDILRMEAAKLDPAASLQDLGLDSLMGVELMMAVEARFGVNIPVMALAEVGTIERLVRRIVKELKRGRGEAADSAQASMAEQVRMVAARHASEIDAQTIEEIAAELKVTEK